MLERGDGAHARRGADEHNVNEEALDVVEPLVRNGRGLRRERREDARLFEKRREPSEPQQHPPVIPVEAML